MAHQADRSCAGVFQFRISYETLEVKCQCLLRVGVKVAHQDCSSPADSGARGRHLAPSPDMLFHDGRSVFEISTRLRIGMRRTDQAKHRKQAVVHRNARDCSSPVHSGARAERGTDRVPCLRQWIEMRTQTVTDQTGFHLRDCFTTEVRVGLINSRSAWAHEPRLI